MPPSPRQPPFLPEPSPPPPPPSPPLAPPPSPPFEVEVISTATMPADVNVSAYEAALVSALEAQLSESSPEVALATVSADCGGGSGSCAVTVSGGLVTETAEEVSASASFDPASFNETTTKAEFAAAVGAAAEDVVAEVVEVERTDARVEFVLDQDADDFDEEEFRGVLAKEAGVDVSQVEVRIRAGSVVAEVTIRGASAAVVEALEGGDTEDALQTALGADVSRQGVERVTQVTLSTSADAARSSAGTPIELTGAISAVEAELVNVEVEREVYLSQHVATGVAATITDGSATIRAAVAAKLAIPLDEVSLEVPSIRAPPSPPPPPSAPPPPSPSPPATEVPRITSAHAFAMGGTDKTVVVYWTEAPSVTGGGAAATIDIGPYGLGHLLGTSRFDAGYGRAVLTGKAAKDVRDAGKAQLDPRNAFGGGPSATATVLTFDALVDPMVAADGGTMLEKCSAHAGCEGLAGDCCPNPAGDYLNCCSEPDEDGAVVLRRCRPRSTTRPPAAKSRA